METWTTTIETGPDGEAYVILPPDLLEKLGWNIGDTLQWNVTEDGIVTISVPNV